MQIKPLADRIIVARSKATTQTPAGVIIPEHHVEQKTTGQVLEVGKDVEEIKQGDVVFFGKFVGTDIKFGENQDTEFLVMKEKDVLAVINVDDETEEIEEATCDLGI